MKITINEIGDRVICILHICILVFGIPYTSMEKRYVISYRSEFVVCTASHRHTNSVSVAATAPMGHGTVRAGNCCSTDDHMDFAKTIYVHKFIISSILISLRTVSRWGCVLYTDCGIVLFFRVFALTSFPNSVSASFAHRPEYKFLRSTFAVQFVRLSSNRC